MSDTITLTIPRERDFHRVAHLVVGGLALRLNLTLEILEDLQLAIDAILDRTTENGDVTVTLSVDGDELETRIGPVNLGEELAHEAGDDLGLRRVLDAVVDTVAVEGEWVRLTKRVTPSG